MSLAEAIGRRRIPEVLHFTTNHGVLGTLAMGAILPRASLPEEKYLEHVYRPNSNVRKDPDWTDHVSASISRVNTEFFGVSRRWHRDTDTWWAILALDPVVLEHPDVVFVTTNNIYPARKRARGEAGFEALFAPVVAGYYGRLVQRSEETPDSHTTDVQAEILYPGPIGASWVRRIYVVNHHHADLVASQYEILARRPDSEVQPELPIHVRPELFQ